MQAPPPPAASQAALGIGIRGPYKFREGWQGRGAVRQDTSLPPSLLVGRCSKHQALSTPTVVGFGAFGGFGSLFGRSGPGCRGCLRRAGPGAAIPKPPGMLGARMRPHLLAAGCCQAVRRRDRPLSALLPAQLTGYSERSPSLSKTPACSSPVTAIPPIRRSLCTPDNMVEIPYYAAFHNAFTRRRDMMFSFMQHASILREEPSQSPSPAEGHEEFVGSPRGSQPASRPAGCPRGVTTRGPRSQQTTHARLETKNPL